MIILIPNVVVDLVEVAAILDALPNDFRFEHVPAFESTTSCRSSVTRERKLKLSKNYKFHYNDKFYFDSMTMY
jgi:hypothetical protein